MWLLAREPPEAFGLAVREYNGAELAMKCAEAPEALDRQHGETPLPKRERSFSARCNGCGAMGLTST